MELGYGFHWYPGKSPYITLPDGTKLVLHVEHYVPYLYDESSHKTNATPATSIDALPQHMPVLPAVESDTDIDDDGPGTAPPDAPNSGRKKINELREEATSFKHLLTHFPEQKQVL